MTDTGDKGICKGVYSACPFLCKCTTITKLIPSRKIAKSIKALHMSVCGFFINFKHSSTIKSGTSSIAAESFPGSFITFYTSPSDTGIMNTVGEHEGETRLIWGGCIKLLLNLGKRKTFQNTSKT